MIDLLIFVLCFIAMLFAAGAIGAYFVKFIFWIAR